MQSCKRQWTIKAAIRGRGGQWGGREGEGNEAALRADRISLVRLLDRETLLLHLRLPFPDILSQDENMTVSAFFSKHSR